MSKIENLNFYIVEDGYIEYANKRDYLGLIRFADMIPVPEKAIKQLDFRDYRNLYSMLLVKQYNYINIPENKKRIKEKAKKLYNIINSDKENKTTYFYKKLCCNFKLLEGKLTRY